jgi:pyruvate kinase
MMLAPNKTKIVCTIGPQCESPEIMQQMLLAGMNIDGMRPESHEGT